MCFSQHDQLYTWAAVNQPAHSLDLCEGKLAGLIKSPWSPAKAGGEHRNGLKSTEEGKQSLALPVRCSLQAGSGVKSMLKDMS